MVKLFVWNLVLLVGLLALAHMYSNANQDRLVAWHSYETQQLCDNGMVADDMRGCYAVEEAYNTEFLCNSNQTNCWVEAK